MADPYRKHSRAKRKFDKKYRPNKGPIARFAGTRRGKLAIAACALAAVAALALLIAFVGVPVVKNWIDPPKEPNLRANPFKDSADTEVLEETGDEDLSELQHEAKIQFSTVNDPYIFGGEIAYSTSSYANGTIVYDKLYLHDTETGEDTLVPGISMKYDNILDICMNESYIVFLDAHANGGGRVCGYDRQAQKMFAIKEYVYAAPKLSLSGNMLAFMQQAGTNLDRLYFYNLQTGEGIAYRVFSGLPAEPTAVDIEGDSVVYAIPFTTDDGNVRSRVYRLSLSTGEEVANEPGKHISYIKTNGEQTAFLSSASGAPTDLYLFDGMLPTLLASEVVNFEVEETHIVYTQNDVVMVYSFETKRHYKLNSNTSRGLLADAHGSEICWYDITGGYGDSVNVVRYAKVEF